MNTSGCMCKATMANSLPKWSYLHKWCCDHELFVAALLQVLEQLLDHLQNTISTTEPPAKSQIPHLIYSKYDTFHTRITPKKKISHLTLKNHRFYTQITWKITESASEQPAMLQTFLLLFFTPFSYFRSSFIASYSLTCCWYICTHTHTHTYFL